jgi:hypothetical protein
MYISKNAVSFLQLRKGGLVLVSSEEGGIHKQAFLI